MTSEVMQLFLGAMIAQAAGFVFLILVSHKQLLWRVEQLEDAIKHSLNNGIRSDIKELNDLIVDNATVAAATKADMDTLRALCAERHRGAGQ